MTKEIIFQSLQEESLDVLDETLSQLVNSHQTEEQLAAVFDIPEEYTSLSQLQKQFEGCKHKGFIALWFFFQLKLVKAEVVQDVKNLRVDDVDFVCFPTSCSLFLSNIYEGLDRWRRKTVVFPLLLKSNGANVNKILDIELQALHRAAVRDSTWIEKIKILSREERKIRELPKSIVQMDYLEALEFKKNEIREPVLPAWVQQIRHKLPPDALAKYMPYPAGMEKLQKLVKIDMSENGISNFPAWICQISSLQELNLRENNLETIPPEIGDLTQLQTLDLYRNPLTTIPVRLTTISSLKELRIPDDENFSLPDETSQLYQRFSIVDGMPNFECAIKTWCSSLYKNIRILELQIKGVLERCANEPGLLEQVTMLDCTGYSLKALPDNIVGLKHLKTLVLQNNYLEVFPEQICQLSTLESLDLNGNRLSQIPESITQLRKLKNLNLSRNNLKDVPDFLNQLSGLVLDLQGNQLAKLSADVYSLKLDREQWYRLHPVLLKKQNVEYLHLDNAGPSEWSEERKANLSKQFVHREAFQQAYLAEGNLWSESSSNANSSTYYRPSVLYVTMRRKLKDLWRQHADRQFFNQQVLAIHWIGWLGQSFDQESFETYLKYNPMNEISNDEVSAHGYWKAEALQKCNYAVGFVLRQKQITYASKVDAWTEELRRKDAGYAIVNPDGTTWKPEDHNYERLKAEMEEAIRKGEKPESNYSKIWDGNAEHNALLKRIKAGEDTEGRKTIPLQEFYQQSGYPKRPMLGTRMDRHALLSEVDIEKSGLIFEMVADNWSWDTVIVREKYDWDLAKRKLIEKVAPEVNIISLKDAIAQFFPSE